MSELEDRIYRLLRRAWYGQPRVTPWDVLADYMNEKEAYGPRFRALPGRREWEGPLWSGRALRLRWDQDLDEEQEQVFYVHELAHWLTASPAQRRAPNWGLGKDYMQGEAGLLVPSVRAADEIEDDVCAMHLVLAAGLGRRPDFHADFVNYELDYLRPVRGVAEKAARLRAWEGRSWLLPVLESCLGIGRRKR